MGNLSAIDLFAGAGGLSKGLDQAGFEILWANEKNPAAAATYKYNHMRTELFTGDIRKISRSFLRKEFRDLVLVAGGPPCQGFSFAGKRNIKDPRNQLLASFCSAVETIKPKLFLMENVKGLLSFNQGNTINKVKRRLEKAGYHVTTSVLNAADFGVPQLRERVFIMGSIDSKITLDIPKYKQVPAADAISDLAFLDSGEKSNEYKCLPTTDFQKGMRGITTLQNHEAAIHSKGVIRRFSLLKPGCDSKTLPSEVRTKKKIVYKLHPRLPSRTVTTLPEDIIHYSKNRILTVRELARLQSFPDSYIFLGPRTTGGERRKNSCPQYTQVGNAVPPLLAKAIGAALVRCIA